MYLFLIDLNSFASSLRDYECGNAEVSEMIYQNIYFIIDSTDILDYNDSVYDLMKFLDGDSSKAQSSISIPEKYFTVCEAEFEENRTDGRRWLFLIQENNSVIGLLLCSPTNYKVISIGVDENDEICDSSGRVGHEINILGRGRFWKPINLYDINVKTKFDIGYVESISPKIIEKKDENIKYNPNLKHNIYITKHRIELIDAGDVKQQRIIEGMVTGNSSYPCPSCEIPNAEIGSIPTCNKRMYAMRTFEDAISNIHKSERKLKIPKLKEKKNDKKKSNNNQKKDENNNENENDDDNEDDIDIDINKEDENDKKKKKNKNKDEEKGSNDYKKTKGYRSTPVYYYQPCFFVPAVLHISMSICGRMLKLIKYKIIGVTTKNKDSLIQWQILMHKLNYYENEILINESLIKWDQEYGNLLKNKNDDKNNSNNDENEYIKETDNDYYAKDGYIDIDIIFDDEFIEIVDKYEGISDDYTSSGSTDEDFECSPFECSIPIDKDILEQKDANQKIILCKQKLKEIKDEIKVVENKLCQNNDNIGLKIWNKLKKQTKFEELSYRKDEINGVDAIHAINNMDYILNYLNENENDIYLIVEPLVNFLQFFINIMMKKNILPFSDETIELMRFSALMIETLMHHLYKAIMKKNRAYVGHKIHILYHVVDYCQTRRFSPAYGCDAFCEILMKDMKGLFRYMRSCTNISKIKNGIQKYNAATQIGYDES